MDGEPTLLVPRVRLRLPILRRHPPSVIRTSMEPERQRLQDDLRGLIEGEVRCDPVFTRMYASDGSIFQIEPLGVVRPQGTLDVVACLQYAAAQGLPVHARGGGTGVAGGCLGPGLIMDFSHSMRRIIRTDDGTVRVQAGVVLANLNRHLQPLGRLFGPDPANAEVSTVGGTLAVNRGGSHFPCYGCARDRVVSLQVVLAHGEVMELGIHAPHETPLGPGETAPGLPPPDLYRQVSELISTYQPAIERDRCRAPVNSSGYLLRDVLQDDRLHMPRLMVGSEGTLGLITEATLQTDLLPKHRGLAVLFFERVEKACLAVEEIRRERIATCDLIDRRLISLARDADVRYDILLPGNAEAMLLVEMHDTDARELLGRLKQLTHLICRRRKLAYDSRTALDPSDVDLYSRLATRILPTLYRLSGLQRPLPFVEDIAVPPEVLPQFLLSVQNLLKRHQVTASLFAHASQGQIHLRPFLDLGNPEDVDRLGRLATELYHEVVEFHGTVAGEHGNGLSRSWFVRKQYPELYRCFCDLKRLFDPAGILNPGKITQAEPQPWARWLRPVSAVNGAMGPLGSPPEEVGPQPMSAPATVGLLLQWSLSDVLMTARACNGCGACRSQSELVRMCPIFRFAPAEEASPRAKANLVRDLVTRNALPEEFADHDLKQVADLCVHCHQCRDECPAGVDIPKLMTEIKAQHVATNGLPLSDWLLSRLDLLATWSMPIRGLANFVIAQPKLRWILERLTGIAQGRKLPRFARRPFLATARRRRWTRPSRATGPKVVYFTDIYANWFDAELAESVVSVFQHNGVTVFVDPRQVQSGMSLISVGAIEQARRLAARNVLLLADAIRQGYHVVTAEPSAALCLTREYPHLLDSDDVRLVSTHTSEACTYLWNLHLRGKLELDFKPLHLTAGYHQPCHSRALHVGSPAENLLRLIPGFSVRPLEKGCTGMAGTYGLKRENFRNSLRAGWPLISAIRSPELQIGATECSTCKMQMEQGTNKPTVHPIKLLALAYGLMPQLAHRLHETTEELVIT